jgi:aldehyde:ferredoxin oxidoreductase
MEGADDLSPEAFSRDVIKRKASCAGCPVGCIQVGRGVSIDYEPVYALGPLLGIKDREAVTALLRRTEDLGLDAMTAGVILSWLTEAYARGAVSRAEVIESPLFGDGKTYLRMLNHLVEWPGDLYRAMALDPLEEVKRRGGEDYFLSIQGVGLAAYHTGYGSLLGQVIGMRHSHLDNGGASLDRKFPDLDDGEIVEKLMAEERVRCLLSSMVLCLFGRKVFTPEAIASCLDAAGLPRDLYETHEAAARIYSLKLELKRLLGYDFSALRVPSRCFEVPSATGMLDRKRLERLNALFVERAGL